MANMWIDSNIIMVIATTALLKHILSIILIVVCIIVFELQKYTTEVPHRDTHEYFRKLHSLIDPRKAPRPCGVNIERLLYLTFPALTPKIKVI